MYPHHMTRRGFIRSSATVGAVAATGLAGAAQVPNEGRPPNVVLIISDDQGWGDYGFMGHPYIRTPNLDRLASESVTFTRGYVVAPLCCPSLASIITGLHPHQHKITSNDPPYEGDPKERWTKPWTPERQALREKLMSHIEEVPTLPRMLRERGYFSLQTGKWWAGSFRQGGFTHGMTHGDMMRGGRHGDEGLKIGRETMQPIYDFLAEVGDRPFFLWYAPMLPHQPHNPPEELLVHYQDQTESIHMARYWAMCEWWDQTCGQLLTHLEERGLDQNTVVLYICDNGWIQKPEAPGHEPRSKNSWYEGGIRTPILVHWPGHLRPRRDETTLVSSIDLAPTILAVCGLKPTTEMQGVNLLDQRALHRREAIFGGSYSHDAVDVGNPARNLCSRWVIRGWWKLVLPEANQPGDNEVQLYNLRTDPQEHVNRASQHPGLVRELSTLIDRWYKPA
ncbi:MAG: sulfatase-like hydrolase/transferase [Candidatus Zipacnadales bacterium]